MSLTQEMRGQPANMLVLRLVDHPNRSMRNAAQWAATMKLERGHFGRHELALLEGAVARLVAEEDGGGVGAGRLSDLVSALPEDARARIRPVVGHAHGERGRPDPSAAARRAAVNLAQETASVTEDSMFERLVVTALSDPTADQRFAAAFVLRSSPWSEELARVCVARVVEQLSSRSGTDRDVLQRTMVLMSIIGREAEREPLARMVENGPANLRPLALFSLGHLPPPASGVEPPRLPLRPLLLGDDERVARAALYCAGMTADPALGEIDDDEALADWLRRGARWWRRNGPAIHEPAPSWTQPP
jgi:hypothetical protein